MGFLLISSSITKSEHEPINLTNDTNPDRTWTTTTIPNKIIGSGSLENDLTHQEALQSHCFDRGSDSESLDHPPRITHYQAFIKKVVALHCEL